jgi:hypothetical protein
MAAFAGLEPSRYPGIKILFLRGATPSEALNVSSFASKCYFAFGIVTQQFAPKERLVG